MTIYYSAAPTKEKLKKVVPEEVGLVHYHIPESRTFTIHRLVLVN